MTLDVLKVFGLSALSVAVGVLLTPILTHYLYKYKLWRKEVRIYYKDGSKTPIFAELHKERERNWVVFAMNTTDQLTT